MSSQPSNQVGLFFSLLHRFTLRYWRTHWLKLALLVSIVGLGTGAFLAIGLANRAATQSFDRFAQTVSGQSQIVVTPSLGKLKRDDLRQMRRALLDSEAALVPQIIQNTRLADRDDIPESDRVFTLVGMDLLAASNFLIRHGADSSFFDSTRAAGDSLRSRSGLYVQNETIQAFGWKAEQEIPLFLEDRKVAIPLAGSLPQLPSDNQAAANVFVIDWTELSELLGKPLYADRVDIVWIDEYKSETAIAAAIKALESNNPGNWIIESQSQRQQTGATMTLALRMNLRALSALSLLVAVFLVFQAMDSAIARRQSEIAILHSLGVPKRLTRLLWFADSTFIGLLGGAMGLLLGSVMARFSTKLVSQTVNTLYYNAGEATLNYATGEAVLAWLLTLCFCVVAGWWPARQAARAPLVESICQGNHRSTYSRKNYILASFGFTALSVIAYLIPPLRAANGHSIPVGGYALSIFLIGLVASVGCLCLELLGSATSWVARFSTYASLAFSQFRRPVTRHRLALSGVALSVGMTAAMVFLIGSFESTVRSWIGNTLQADIFIRPKSISSAHNAQHISLSVVEQISSDPRASDLGSIHFSSIRIQNLPTQLVGFDTDYLSRIQHTTWIKKPRNLLDLKNGGTAIVNEAFASRFQVDVGDSISILSQPQAIAFEVIGIFADYGNENGSIGIDQKRFIELTGEPRPKALALHLEDPATLDAMARELEAAHPGLQVMSNRWLREESLRIFKRVFSITYALEAIGLIISIAGLGSMLASLLIERRSETSTLQRIGFGPRQISLATACEGVALTGLAVTAGLVLGIVLGLVLVFIINRQSFGWTLAVSVPWPSLLALAALTIGGSAVVSYLVGSWSSKLPPVTEE